LNPAVSSQITMNPGVPPHKRGRHYRIIVGNNPVNFYDPRGLQGYGADPLFLDPWPWTYTPHFESPPPRPAAVKMDFSKCPFPFPIISRSASYCKDTFLSGILHDVGDTCFRQMEGGWHICYTPRGGCKFHHDAVNPCCRGENGECTRCFGSKFWDHFFTDVLTRPKERRMY
jgi:hypothetical protein